MIRRWLLPAVLSVFAAAQVQAAQTFTLGRYLYDGSGNVWKIGAEQKFEYDAFGRLTKGTVAPGRYQSYTYDRFGNLLTITTDQPSGLIELGMDGNTNRLTNTNKPAWGSYDNAGRMTSAVHSGGASTFQYDATAMVKQSVVGGVTKVHLYSATDERIASITLTNGAESSSEWTIRDTSGRVLRRLERSGGNWTWREDYIYRDGQLLASEVDTPSGTQHFHLDHLGTPRLITGNGGVEISRHTYYPFGMEVDRQTNERRKFTGHERDFGTDAANDLDYMHARYYTPAWGRFLSVDPAWESTDLRAPQTWNRYTYARNNPLRFTDPDGRVAAADDVAIGLVVGTVFVSAYVASPSAVPGKTKGQVLLESAIDGLASFGRWLMEGNTAGGGGEMAAETYVQNSADDAQKEQDRGSEGGDRAGKPFTPKGKKEIHDRNAQQNNGENRCEKCDQKVVPGEKSKKGVTPPGNERQADHIKPKSKGGDGSPSNGQTLCRDCNRAKSNKDPK